MRRPLLACLLVLAGCGGRVEDRTTPSATSDTGAEAEVARTLAEACADQVNAVCTDLARCGSLFERWRFADESTCRTENLARCLGNGALPGVLDAVAAADRCTAAINSSACATSARTNAWLRDCEGLGSVGAFADGSRCIAHAQCAGGWCRDQPGDHCGACTRAPRVGDPCEEDFPGCAVVTPFIAYGVLRCDTATKRCVEVEVASSSLPTTFAALGETCDVPPDTDEPWCAGATYCHYTRKCEPAHRIGESCRGQKFECGWDAVCIHAVPDEFGVCTPLADVCR